MRVLPLSLSPRGTPNRGKPPFNSAVQGLKDAQDFFQSLGCCLFYQKLGMLSAPDLVCKKVQHKCTVVQDVQDVQFQGLLKLFYPINS